MKTKYLLFIVLIAVISSCSSAYRTTQTPDDVYYSPAPPPPIEYVTTENQQDRDSYASNNSNVSEDIAIRRGINDSRYRSNLSLDLGYGDNPYDYYGSSLYSPYTPYYSPYGSYYNAYNYTGITFYPHNYNYYGYSPYNSYYYSPFYSYYYPQVYVSGPAPNYNVGPRTYNLGVYNSNINTNRVNTHPGQSNTDAVPVAPVRSFPAQPVTSPVTNTNRTTGVGNLIRRVFSGSDNSRSYNNNNYNNNNSSNNNNNNNSNSSPVRTTGSSSSGGSSSSSGSGSAPVRTFRH